MKKTGILFILFATQISFAQNKLEATGNVGIGTLTPSEALDVNGNTIIRGRLVSTMPGDIGGSIRLANPSKTANGAASGWMIYNMTGTYGNSLQFWAYDNLGCVSGGLCSNQFTIMDTGNVGIGTNIPFSKLSINGSLTLNGGLTNTKERPAIARGTLTNGEIRAYSSTGNAYDDGFLRLSAGGGTNAITKSYIDLSGYSTVPDMNRNIVFGTFGLERMRIDLDGNVGIGTQNPKNKLDVNGTIHSKEVKVDIDFPAPDYVFANDYNLRSLPEVEKYIKENNHLPEIPSAKEIEKNGIHLAEMNMALLKKIEELTLYAIEQQKNSDQLMKIIQEQNKRLEVLEKAAK
ncbi:hypothetical protein [Flavobacterium gelatinilyticum]|uniref:hypothetical protein n=1 Tax=Flavobacterium gelatinilyticum TaxID=3003260 RepID=UPI0024815708|nr:hypothetical protein [Flavobacterium gelatinilyticum]